MLTSLNYTFQCVPCRCLQLHTGFLVKILTSNNLADTFVWGPSLRNFSSRRDMIETTFILENFTPEIVRFSDKCEN